MQANQDQSGHEAMEVDGSSSNSKTPSPQPTFLRDLSQEMQRLTCMSVSRTRPLVAAVSLKGYIGVWNYKTGELERKDYVQSGLSGVAISHDGTQVAAVGEDGLRMIWDIKRWCKRSLKDPSEDDEQIFSVLWSPDDKFIATGSVDFMGHLWNAQTGELLLSFLDVYNLIVGFSPDSSRLATFQDQDTVGHIWDTRSGRLLKTLPESESTVERMSFSPEGGRIATCSEDGTIRIWSIQTGHQLVAFHERGGSIRSFMFSPDGKEIALARLGGKTIVIYDSFSGVHRRTFAKQLSDICKITYSHCGRFIASWSIGGRVQMRDTLTGDCRAEFHADKVDGHTMTFSGDDKQILLLSYDDSILVWSLCDVLSSD